MSSPPRQQLRDLLAKTVRTGTITLSSGRTTDFYIDGRQVTLSPAGLALVSTLCWQVLRGRCTAVGGPTAGADPMVAGIGLEAHRGGDPLKLFFTRKESKGHGMKRRMEGPSLSPEDRVVIVDDVATSGGSLLRSAEIVREDVGAKVALALVIVDREEGAVEALRDAGIELLSLFKRRDLV